MSKSVKLPTFINHDWKFCLHFWGNLKDISLYRNKVFIYRLAVSCRYTETVNERCFVLILFPTTGRSFPVPESSSVAAEGWSPEKTLSCSTKLVSFKDILNNLSLIKLWAVPVLQRRKHKFVIHFWKQCFVPNTVDLECFELNLLFLYFLSFNLN